MLKKLMASLGVGSAKVNLVLDKEHWRIGESIKGKMLVEGGSVDQEIHTLDVDIVMKFSIKGREFTKVVDTLPVARNFLVRAKESQEIPFEHDLPAHYPISKSSVSYHLATKMDIARSVDSGDTDKLIILPGRDMEVVMNALETLGFKEKIGSGKIGRFGQEFDYYPTAIFADQLRELEFTFYVEGRNMKMFLELKLAGGFMVSRGGHHTELAIPTELLAEGSVRQVADHIQEFLENELREVSLRGPRFTPNYEQYQHGSGRPGFGGFIGGMAAGLLGAVMLNSLFDGAEDTGVDDGEMAGGEEDAGGGFDLDFGGFDDEF